MSGESQMSEDDEESPMSEDAEMEVDFAENGCATDKEIVVGKTVFKVHSQVLSMASPYFNTLFNGSFAEKHQQRVLMEDLDSDMFLLLLNNIYPLQKPNTITMENVEDLMVLSDRLDVQRVMCACEEFLLLLQDSRVNNFKIFNWAVRYNMQRLKAKLRQTFRRSDSKILTLKENVVWPIMETEAKAIIFEILLDRVIQRGAPMSDRLRYATNRLSEIG